MREESPGHGLQTKRNFLSIDNQGLEKAQRVKGRRYTGEYQKQELGVERRLWPGDGRRSGNACESNVEEINSERKEMRAGKTGGKEQETRCNSQTI